MIEGVARKRLNKGRAVLRVPVNASERLDFLVMFTEHGHRVDIYK